METISTNPMASRSATSSAISRGNQSGTRSASCSTGMIPSKASSASSIERYEAGRAHAEEGAAARPSAVGYRNISDVSLAVIRLSIAKKRRLLGYAADEQSQLHGGRRG